MPRDPMDDRPGFEHLMPGYVPPTSYPEPVRPNHQADRDKMVKYLAALNSIIAAGDGGGGSTHAALLVRIAKEGVK